MTKSGIVLVCAAFLAVAGGAIGQPPAPEKGPAPEKKATHDELRAVREGMLEAIKTKDSAALLAHLHPDVVLTVLDDRSLTVVRKHEGVRDYLTRLFTGPKAGVKVFQPALTMDEQTILHGDETGIAFGSSSDHYVLADNSEFDVPTRWSATLVRHEGKWKIANLQVSSNPFDNPVVTSLTRKLYWFAGGGAAGGFLLGMLVMSLLGRARKPAST